MSLIADYTWQVEVTFGDSSEERFKFDINGDWSLNYGDSNGNGYVTQGGDDIRPQDGPGIYVITFNDNTNAYSLVKSNDNSNETPLEAPIQTLVKISSYVGETVYFLPKARFPRC